RASVVGTVPGATSADAGFLRDMQTHHAQAVEMAMLLRDRTDDPELRAISYDIATAQAQQSGIMYGWLQQWGLDQYGVPMLWMRGSAEHSGHGGAPSVDATMPGMATREQLAALEAADGLEAERLFLELMIAHHEGGIDMAEAAVRLAGQPIVRDFAAKMITVQTAEIETMERMLAER
ncbi:MAG TPA: DUF305 domain-containing protein, partial [Microbacteriaceae bacterium]|nr:DUF305 domain-containing protein [Microbacteriaceae bacterium]